MFFSCSSIFAREVIPSPTPTLIAEQEYNFSSMTTYELFWPIVAGKVPGDRFYQFKLWRDKLAGFLFFDRLKQSEYFKQLANKRLLEAEKLVELQRYSSLPGTLKRSYDNLEKGLTLLLSAQESQAQFWLKGEYIKDFQKHLIVLERMKEKAKDEEKTSIEESLKKIKDLIFNYQLQGAN